MKKIITPFILFTLGFLVAKAQFSIEYHPGMQPKGNMQYFVPVGGGQFVGDCIPFYHLGTYYLFWLLDEGHHSALNGLGGHQWVVSTTKDLKNWEHHPIAIGIDEDWEKSICTGSVAWDEKRKTYFAFYATRLINQSNEVNEQLSYAVSHDGITFKKQKPNPFYSSAPGYSRRDFRDPKVVIDKSGVFHLFVSSNRESENSIDENKGCLVHLTSTDLRNWTVNEPILSGQRDVPECPDYFQWNSWYYLLYSQGGRTFYLKSQKPYGPWEQPLFQTFDEDWSNVVKTAEFTGGRRIAASWIPGKKDNRDNGHEIFGGNVLLREVIQLKDGTLATGFPPETLPETGEALVLNPIAGQNAVKVSRNEFQINAQGSIGCLHADQTPLNCRITMEVIPEGRNEEIGMYLRASEKASQGYKLIFSANNQTVSLANTRIEGVQNMNKPFSVEIIMKGDIIDVCVGGERCIINRLPERKGDVIWFYAKHGNVIFRNIQVFPIKD